MPRVGGSFAPKVVKRLHDTDDDGRKVAAEALGKFGPEVGGSIAPKVA